MSSKARKLVREWKEKGDLPEDYAEPSSDLHDAYNQMGKARRKGRGLLARINRMFVARDIKAARRHAQAARESEQISKGREAAKRIRATSDTSYAAQREAELGALKLQREAAHTRRARDREMTRERVRPYRESLTSTGRVMGRGAATIGRSFRKVGRGAARTFGPGSGIGKRLDRFGEAMTAGVASRPPSSSFIYGGGGKVSSESLDKSIFGRRSRTPHTPRRESGMDMGEFIFGKRSPTDTKLSATRYDTMDDIISMDTDWL